MLQKPQFEYEIINAFYEYLLKNGLKESTCKDYCGRIQAICKEFHITPEELFDGRARYTVDDLIGKYSTEPVYKEENARRHNALLSALKQFKKFKEESAGESAEEKELRRRIIDFIRGASSFVNSSAVPAVLSATDFWEDFAEFLRDAGLKESTIQCYIKQYLKRTFEGYLGMGLSDFSKLGDEEKCALVRELHARLSTAKCSVGGDSKKTVQNYSSAVGALGDFLESLEPPIEEQEEAGEVPAPFTSSEEEPTFCEDDVDDTYTYKEFLSKFRSRLITQDRSYEKGYLPCSHPERDRRGLLLQGQGLGVGEIEKRRGDTALHGSLCEGDPHGIRQNASDQGERLDP